MRQERLNSMFFIISDFGVYKTNNMNLAHRLRKGAFVVYQRPDGSMINL